MRTECLRGGCFFALELSSQVQQLIEENFKRRSPTETFAGTKIDLVGKGGEERRIKGLQVDRLGAILADKAIRVFVSAPHPWGVRRWKEERNITECSRDLSMFSKLLATIRSDGTNEFGRQGTKQANHPITNMSRGFLGNL